MKILPKTVSFILCLLLPIFGAADASARSQTCGPMTERGVAALFDRWNTAVASGDPNAVVALYAPISVLLPTLSNTPRFSREDKLDYFEHFLGRKPRGEIDRAWIEVDCNTAIDAGLYTFTFADGRRVRARYTFTYKLEGGRWLITSHHSSAMPEADAAR